MDALSRLDGLAPAAEAQRRAAALLRLAALGRAHDRAPALSPIATRLFAPRPTTAWRRARARGLARGLRPPSEDRRPGDALRARFAETRQWAEGEQAGTLQASEETLHGARPREPGLRGRASATSSSCARPARAADEMLRPAARTPRPTTPTTELRIAAGEQAKITRLRLQKLWPREERLMSAITTHVLDTARGRPRRRAPGAARASVRQGALAGPGARRHRRRTAGFRDLCPTSRRSGVSTVSPSIPPPTSAPAKMPCFFPSVSVALRGRATRPSTTTCPCS